MPDTGQSPPQTVDKTIDRFRRHAGKDNHSVMRSCYLSGGFSCIIAEINIHIGLMVPRRAAQIFQFVTQRFTGGRHRQNTQDLHGQILFVC